MSYEQWKQAHRENMERALTEVRKTQRRCVRAWELAKVLGLTALILWCWWIAYLWGDAHR
jgi:hypothetical protein